MKASWESTIYGKDSLQDSFPGILCHCSQACDATLNPALQRLHANGFYRDALKGWFEVL